MESLEFPYSTRFYNKKSNLVPTPDITHVGGRFSLVKNNYPSEETDK
jgi:hypothetical protein